MKQIIVLNGSGDLRKEWEFGDASGQAAAEATFTDMKAKGYLAYKTDGKGADEQIHKFDPEADRITMTPPLVGG